MSEEGNKEIKNPEKDSEFIINRGEEKIFGPGKEHETGYKNWLADEKEIEAIKNKRLQGVVRQLNKINPQKLNSNFLLNRYIFLQDEFSELENQPIDDFLARIYLQVEELQNKENIGGVSLGNLNIDIEALVNKISEGQKNFQENLLKAFKDQKITFEQLLNLSQKPVEVLTDSFKRVPPKEERKRWVDVEYRQEFWTKFTPSMEPRFYTELEEGERRLFDTRWQLARAAYFKKATVASPEKMIENQDLIMLGMEQMEKLYKIPGVRQALEWYAKKIVLDKSFWDCKNEIKFEQIREEMRKFIKKNVSSIKVIKDEEEKGRLAKDADAVAWNLMWVSNLVESADSRYSKSVSGGRHDGLPGVLASDDLRAVFHSQEKYENKCTKRQEWGVFGKWGVVQLSNIQKEIEGEISKKEINKKIEEVKNKIKFDNKKDKIEQKWLFRGASSFQDFWRHDSTEIEIKEDKPGYRVINVNHKVFAPECYPTTSMRSFWEEINFEDDKGEKIPLIDFLLEEKKINWRELKSAFWVDYIPIKLNKAVQLLKYFKGETRLIETKENEWVKPLIDIFVRLKLDKNKNFHNLKVWSVYSGLGGVLQPESKIPSIPLRFMDRSVMGERLKRPEVRFLEKGERLNLSY